jgi:hypothetical protein
MSQRSFVISLFAVLLAGCDTGASPVVSMNPEKLEGPPVTGLTHEQLMSFYSECTTYGRMDDPRVKYSARYCSAISSAQQMEGYSKAAVPKVDPNPVKMH